MFSPATKIVGLLLFALLLAVPGYAQENTKGDKPASTRETRFSSKKGKKPKVKKAKERKTRDHRAFRPRTSPPAQDDGRTRGVTDNKRVVARPSQQDVKAYPQSGRFVNNPSVRPTRDGRPPRSNKKIIARNRAKSARQQPSNIYPQRGRFVNNPSPRPSQVIRAQSNKRQISRLKRLQGPDPKPGRKARIVTRSASRSFTARKSINVMASYPRPKRKGERAYTRDISGRKLRRRNYESPSPSSVKSPGGGERFSSSGRSRTYVPGRRKLSSRRSSTARVFYPQHGRFVNNPSKNPRKVERGTSNESAKRRLRKLQDQGPPRRRPSVVVPRSATSSFRASRSPNTWAHFPRPKRKGERAYTRDIAGHKLRKLNYETPRPGVLTPEYSPYTRRRKPGDRAYKGPASGYHVSGTRRARAWIGDIAGRKIRGIKKPRTGKPGIITGGYKTATSSRPGKAPLAVKAPGVGARRIGQFRGTSVQGKLFRNQGESYSGNIKARRPLKGGGSVSGRRWNNNGTPIAVRGPGDLRPGRFQGTLKARRPDKGGGSVSGKLWNNRQSPVAGKSPRGPNINTLTKSMRRSGKPGFRNQGENYAGNIRARKLQRARANVNEFPSRLRRFSDQPGFADQGEQYTGSIKARRPLKGGGSVSGKLWNNKQTPVPGKTWRGANINAFTKSMRTSRTVFRNQGENFSGNIKTRRPDKGGGSVSGKLWNNKQTPLPVKSGGADINTFTRSMKRPGKAAFMNQGEEYTGNIKAKRPDKGGGSVSGRLWNNNETPIAVRTPKADGEDGYSGNVRLSRFKRQYVKNPNASALALKKTRPSGNVFRGNELMVKVKQPGYERNSSSSEQSLKAREPGKAFARSADYQGNIKMKKFVFFQKNRNLHPDAQFVKANRNNVAGEKDPLTNFKLWWARLFKKNDTQPEHLKSKVRRPRYDPGEKGMWND